MKADDLVWSGWKKIPVLGFRFTFVVLSAYYVDGQGTKYHEKEADDINYNCFLCKQRVLFRSVEKIKIGKIVALFCSGNLIILVC